MGDYRIVELAKVITSKEELIQIMQEVFDLLNPDDWWSLGTTLINLGPDISKNARLVFGHLGYHSNFYRFQPENYEIEIRCENLHGVFEIFSSKIPERIDITEGGFIQVHQLTKQFFPWGYRLVKLEAKTGHDHYALPYTKLDMGLPDFGWHHPTISLISNVPGEEDYSFVAKPILDLLRSRGYRV